MYDDYALTGQRKRFYTPLRKLTRTFIYHRAEGGRLEIIDHVRYSSPQTFGTAVVMRPEAVRQTIGPLTFRVAERQGGAVDVTCEALRGGELVLSDASIRGIMADKPTKGVRVGMDFKSPVTEGIIRLVITPES